MGFTGAGTDERVEARWWLRAADGEVQVVAPADLWASGASRRGPQVIDPALVPWISATVLGAR